MRTVIALLLALVAANATPLIIKVGKPFPILDLPLAGDEDKSASILEYRGRKLMLHLFASW